MKTHMAIHSKSSFDESDAVRMLSNILEGNETIKTFFSENDKTPNHDGFFELISKSGEPKKQFIVQIKKTNALEKCTSGKNIGKYVYLLDTKFLYYVKERVTENPAIYFVVDIDNKRVFYLYLSDEALINLGFEGKAHISYAFSDDEVLKDIDAFYNKMDAIAVSRNQKLIYKSPEEIIDLQEAADYINNLFNGDFKTIKQYVFPNLWRFGIGYSKSTDFKMTHYIKNDNTKYEHLFSDTNMFGIYPQYKGEINQEFREFGFDDLGGYIDCTGRGKPIDYVKKSVHEIIKKFCINPPAELLPDKVIEERIFKKSFELNRLFRSDTNDIYVDETIRLIEAFFSYIGYIFDSNHIDSPNESNFKKAVLNLMPINPHCIDFSDFLMMGCIVAELLEYYNKNEIYTFSETGVELVTPETILFYNDLLELKKRGLKVVASDWTEAYSVVQGDDLVKVQNLFSSWLTGLPEIYYDFYQRIFDSNNAYRYRCKVDYYIEQSQGVIKYDEIINVYNCNHDYIEINNKKISHDFSVEDKENGVISKIGSLLNVSMFNRQQLYFDGIRCWLYQGICKKLGFKCDGLYLGGGLSYRIFE